MFRPGSRQTKVVCGVADRGTGVFKADLNKPGDAAEYASAVSGLLDLCRGQEPIARGQCADAKTRNVCDSASVVECFNPDFWKIDLTTRAAVGYKPNLNAFPVACEIQNGKHVKARGTGPSLDITAGTQYGRAAARVGYTLPYGHDPQRQVVSQLQLKHDQGRVFCLCEASEAQKSVLANSPTSPSNREPADESVSRDDGASPAR